MPGQEFMQPVQEQVGDAGEGIGEPGDRIDVVKPTGADQAEHHRSAANRRDIHRNGCAFAAPASLTGRPHTLEGMVLLDYRHSARAMA